jgi:hypothetical protein
MFHVSNTTIKAMDDAPTKKRRPRKANVKHHQDQMEALRAEFHAWWQQEWPKLRNMGHMPDEPCANNIAWRAYRQVRSKRAE